MGVDLADFRNSGHFGVAITNFDNEMTGLYEFVGKTYEDVAAQSGVGLPSKNSLGFDVPFSMPALMAGSILRWPTATSTKPYAIFAECGICPAPLLFLTTGAEVFEMSAAEVGGGFDLPKVGRGLAYA